MAGVVCDQRAGHHSLAKLTRKSNPLAPNRLPGVVTPGPDQGEGHPREPLPLPGEVQIPWKEDAWPGVTIVPPPTPRLVTPELNEETHAFHPYEMTTGCLERKPFRQG